MKRRFVFISRFSIAGGLASGAVVEQFPACMSVCLCLYVCVRDSVSSARALCLSACVFMCLHVCICTLLCVSAFAWRSLYRPEQNSLVKRAAISATLGEERTREEERVRGNDKWLGHTSRN